MNQYLFLRRMRGPILLLVFGITAILDEWAGINYWHSWPLYIIALGVLKLAENAILAQNPPVPPTGYPGSPMPGNTGYAPWPAAGTPGTTDPTTTAIVPSQDTSTHDEGRR